MRKAFGQSLALLLGLAQLSIAIPRAVLAQAASPSPKDEARDRFDRGLKLFNEGDNAAALAEFKRAYELIPNPVVLFNIGLVYAAMGRPVEATDALTKVIADPGNLSAERLARAKQTHDEQAVRVAELNVVTNVPATIEIDNVEAGKTPLSAPLRIAGGQRIVGAIATGYEPLRKELTVAGGTKAELKMDLVPMQGRAAHVKVNTHLPGADVFIDGQALGKTPLATSLTVTPGQHKIELRRAGYTTAQQDLTLGDGASGEVTLEPEPDAAALVTDGGTLALDISETQSVLTVDGKPRGPYVGSVRLPKGEHRIVVERGGFEPFERMVTVDTGRATTVPIALEPTPDTRAAYVSRTSSQRTWGFISMFGGVALAGGGVGLLIVDSSSKNDAKAVINRYNAESKVMGNGICDNYYGRTDSPACLQLQSDYQAALNKQDGAQSRDKIGYVMVGVGGAATLLGVYLLLSGDSPHKYDRKTGGDQMRFEVLPVVGPSGVGLTGRF